jgi:hypothetical protein
MRYARQTCQEITIYWYVPVSRYGLKYHDDPNDVPEHLHCFFKNIPNVTLKTWVPNIVDTLVKESAVKLIYDGSLVIPEFMKRDRKGNIIYPRNRMKLITQPLRFPRYNNVIINMPTHPFGFDNDTNHLLMKHTYPINAGVKEKDQYELELSKFARKLEPINDLENVIRYYRNRIDDSMKTAEKKYKMGLHIRRTDLKTNISLDTLDHIVDKYYNIYKNDHVFWICSDDYNLQQRYTSIYPDLISYQDPNNLAGIKKSIIDLYLLAYCDHIVGTKGSSFSYYSWIISKDDTLFEVGF